MSKNVSLLGRGALAGAAMLLGAAGWQTFALAGSSFSTDTYAGDYTLFALPAGTFIPLDYLGVRHVDDYTELFACGDVYH